MTRIREAATLLSLCLAATLLPATESQCISANDTQRTIKPNSEADLYRGQQIFTLNLFNTINKAMPNENIFFSPHSVYHSLLLAYFSSGGQTEQGLHAALKLGEDQDKLDVMTAYKVDQYTRTLRNSSGSYEFNTANRVFADQHLAVRDCMLKLFQNDFQKMDFADAPEQSRLEINEWVSNATKRHIQDLLPPNAISSSSKLVLANAAYFKGVWKSKFLPENTKKDVFYISAMNRTLVPMMRQKGVFHYSIFEELGAHVLELPYKGNDISMFIFLPPFASPNGLSNIIEKLTPARLATLVSEGALMAREVVVEIPKFSADKELQMRSILETMGVGDLFEETSDFSTFTDNKVVFDDAVHKAKIQIDEEGTVAAAATAIFGFRSSRPLEPAKFTANYPFVYLLYDRPSSSVLFMGVLRDPKK